MTLRQLEDGSLTASMRKTTNAGSVAATVAIDSATLERWLMRQMRQDLMPMRDTITIEGDR